MLVWRAKQKEVNHATSGPTTVATNIDSSNASGGEETATVVEGTDHNTNNTAGSRNSPIVPTAAAPVVSVSQSQLSGSFQTERDSDSNMTMQELVGHRQVSTQMSGWNDTSSPLTSSSSPYPQNSAMQMSELSSAAFRRMSQHHLQEQQRQQEMMFRRQQQQAPPFLQSQVQAPHQDALLSGDQFRQQTDLTDMNVSERHSAHRRRLETLARNPDSRMASMIGGFDEFRQSSQGMPASMGGYRSQDRFNASWSPPMMADRELQDGTIPCTTMDQRLSLERRNTWSGMSSAQLQISELQHEQEIINAQLQENQAQYFQELRRSSVTTGRDAGGIVMPGMHHNTNERLASIMGRGSSWMDPIHGVQQRTDHSQSMQRHLSEQQPQYQQHRYSQQGSSARYPSDWFEADSNMEDTGESMDDEPIRLSPDGDLNEKLAGRTTSSLASSAFGGQQNRESSLFIQGKKLSTASSGSSSKGGGGNNQVDPTLDPSSMQALGMRFDDETLDFLTKLRFGNPDSPSGDVQES
jgi:hypothetical protein